MGVACGSTRSMFFTDSSHGKLSPKIACTSLIFFALLLTNVIFVVDLYSQSPLPPVLLVLLATVVARRCEVVAAGS